MPRSARIPLLVLLFLGMFLTAWSRVAGGGGSRIRVVAEARRVEAGSETWRLEVANDGRTPLSIVAVEPTCTCVEFSEPFRPRTLAPKERLILDIEVRDRPGDEALVPGVRVQSDDIARPVVWVDFETP